MGPVAAGVSVLFVTLALVGIVIGAVGGALSWWAERGLTRGALGSGGVYLVLTLAVMGPAGPAYALPFGVPALVCFFLLTCLIARRLRAWGLHAIGSTVVALVTALVTGGSYTLTFRLGFAVPFLLVLAGTLALLAWAVRAQRHARTKGA